MGFVGRRKRKDISSSLHPHSALSFRALADILRQQGPVPVSQYEHDDMAVMDGSPKDETPVRASKNHYTPVHSKASNHGRYITFKSFLSA